MMKFAVLNSIADIKIPVYHYDPKIFVDESDWYLRFERIIFQGESILRIGYGESSDSVDSHSSSNKLLVFPLHRYVTTHRLKVLSSLENYYSVDYRPLCSCASLCKYIEPLLRHILRVESPDVLLLRGLDTEAPETALLLRALEGAKWRPYVSTHQINWLHEMTGDFEDYLAGLPTRLRSTLKRKTKRVMGLSGAKMTVHDGQHDLKGVLQAYKRIYDNSWKVPEPHTDFIPDLIRASARRGHLRLGLLSIHATPVAVHFWVVKHGTAFIYKLAHDIEYDRFSPGTVLMGHMVKHVMQRDGVTRLDFLSGDDTYKRDWMSVRREKIRIIAYNPASFFAQITRIRDEYARPFVRRLVCYCFNLRKNDT